MDNNEPLWTIEDEIDNIGFQRTLMEDVVRDPEHAAKLLDIIFIIANGPEKIISDAGIGRKIREYAKIYAEEKSRLST